MLEIKVTRAISGDDLHQQSSDNSPQSVHSSASGDKSFAVEIKYKPPQLINKFQTKRVKFDLRPNDDSSSKESTKSREREIDESPP